MGLTDRNDHLMRAAFAPARGLEPSDAEVAAAMGRAKSPARRAARIARWHAPRVISIGVACLLFAGTAMATGVWDPPIGTEAPDSPPPSISTTPVSAAVTDSLAVLRREPTDQDRGPEVEATLKTLGAAFSLAGNGGPNDSMAELLETYAFKYGVRGVRPDSVRYLAPAANGEATILFSAEDGGFGIYGPVGRLAAGQAESAEPLFLDGQGICIYKPIGAGTPLEGVGEGLPVCFVLEDVLDGRAVWSTAGGLEPSGGAYGIVPDGVASVTARFPNGTEVQAPVADNYFQLTWGAAQSTPVPGEDRGERAINEDWEEPTGFLWRDAAGAVVPHAPRG